jgi:DNA-binding transcriptional regulator YhcF (GntR family)
MPIIELDPASPLALYLQIAEQVRRLVALGALRPGDRLPTVRELAVSTRVNRNTAARAIQQLEGEGIVRTRVGQGTFVADGADRIGRARREQVVETAIERLLTDAQAVGLPFEELGPRLERSIARRGGTGDGDERGNA